MALIPDISAILAIAFDDEDAAYAEAVIEAIGADEAIVPTLFWFELRNALIMGERRKRLTPVRTAAFLSDLALLPFSVDESPREAIVLDLARQHALTVYDAAYLELAQRKNLPLATLDDALIKAAKNSAIAIFKPGSK
ncbi:MAG: type II toxin-antitoxin system VapC family toxin [Phycisphaerae bacterium]|nr:type II toxin-antitoxin system VapC family toxin [Phycisphaerae bacterium]